jgi:hypothetical protein
MYRPPPISGKLRAILDEWNALVPQASGLPRVRLWTREPATEKQGLERLNWLKAQLMSRASTFGLTFGAEIEALLPQGQYREGLRDAIRAIGLTCEIEDLNHTTRTWWKLTTDGSLGDYVRGTETVSPILIGDDGFAALRTVCDVLTAMPARITTNCGLHIHVGVKGRDVGFFKRLVKLYATYEPVIDTWMARSRRDDTNRMCSTIRSYADNAALYGATTLDELGVAYGINVAHARQGRHGHAKYRKLNLYNVWDRGTVEFRHHHGTVDKVKVENWARLCMRMVLAAADETLVVPPLALLNSLTESAENADRVRAERFETFMTLVKASDEEKTYFAGRVAHFAQQDRNRRPRRRRY